MLKRLMGCIREYLRDTLLTPLFMIGEVICECNIPIITASLINNIEAGCEMSVIWQHGLRLLLFAVISVCCGILGGITAANASAGFAKNLRHDLYYKVQEYSFSNIDNFSTSSLVTRLTTDVSNVQMSYMQILSRVSSRNDIHG